MRWIEQANEQKKNWNEVFSFEEYMNQAEKRPDKYVRPTGAYFKDVFDYFGHNEKEGFQLFKKAYPGSIPIYGQFQGQQRIYENLCNFCEEGFNNKLILLVGPNGSSKTSLIRKIIFAAEEYSQTDEGPLHTFSWIFPNENHLKGALGLGNTQQSGRLESFAHLEESDIAAIVSSELRDHPLLLIPKNIRKKILDEWFPRENKLHDQIKKSSLYNGTMAAKNQMIYDALLREATKGDYFKVLKHIRVERFARLASVNLIPLRLLNHSFMSMPK